MNLNNAPFSRSAEPTAPAWRLQEETQTVPVTDLCANHHPGAPTNDAPVEFRASQPPSYRKRSSDCPFAAAAADEDLGRFLSSYLGGDCTDDSTTEDAKSTFDSSLLVEPLKLLQPEPLNPVCATTQGEHGAGVAIDPIPLGRTAELKLQIEAQALKVRKSLCTGKNKRRRTFRSEPVNPNEPVKFVASNECCLESFSAAAANARQIFQGYNDWRTNSSYDSDRSSFVSCSSPDELSLSNSSNAWGNKSSCSKLFSSHSSYHCSAQQGMQQGGKRGSIKDLIGPMSAMLSSMQSTSRSMTLNANSLQHVIKVSKNDVVCGSGALTDALIGNRRYKVFVDLHSHSYAKAYTEEEKICVASSVVNTIRSSVPAGRFLKLDLQSGLWREVADQECGDNNQGGAVTHVERALKEAGGVSSLEPTSLAAIGTRLQARHCSSSASAAVRAVAA